MAVLKRSLSTANGHNVLNGAYTHPLKTEVLRANASKTRDHGSKYHNVLDKYDILKDLNEPLLAWYGTRGDLPWRTDLSDDQLQALSEDEKAQRAYQVWVSEIMLQQTQVATVIPYFKRWLEAFPTINKLSESSIEEVNSLWKGLGYYSRASRLLAGSKTVVKRYKGKLPSHPDELVKEIEGIGPYTAGAIASIAYGVRTPTVDGNIQRVICRFLAIYADMKKKNVLDYIWERAEELVPEKRAGHWNQALMDLGATVCTPKNPKCEECPLNKACLAYAETRLRPTKALSNDIENVHTSPLKSDIKKACSLCLPLDPTSHSREVTLYPLKVVKKKSRDEDISVCVTRWSPSSTAAGGDGAISSADKILLIKRPEKGLLAGLDEFPSVVMPDNDSTAASRLEASLEKLEEILSISSETLQSASKTRLTYHDSIRHIYSHINATFHCTELILETDTNAPPKIRSDMRTRAKWVDVAEVDNANISTGHVKVWKSICEGGKNLLRRKSQNSAGSSSKTKIVKKEEKGQLKLSFGMKSESKTTKTDGAAVVSISTASSISTTTIMPDSGSPVRLLKKRSVGEGVPEFEVENDARVPTPGGTPRKKRRISISSSEGEETS